MAGKIIAGTISDGTNESPVTDVVKGSARAWINFNGQGTVSIREDYNVDVLTDLGTGKYSITFINPMPTINYTVAACVADDNTSARFGYESGTSLSGRTTSSFTMYTANSGGTPLDASVATFTFFG